MADEEGTQGVDSGSQAAAAVAEPAADATVEAVRAAAPEGFLIQDTQPVQATGADQPTDEPKTDETPADEAKPDAEGGDKPASDEGQPKPLDQMAVTRLKGYDLSDEDIAGLNALPPDVRDKFVKRVLKVDSAMGRRWQQIGQAQRQPKEAQNNEPDGTAAGQGGQPAELPQLPDLPDVKFDKENFVGEGEADALQNMYGALKGLIAHIKAHGERLDGFKPVAEKFQADQQKAQTDAAKAYFTEADKFFGGLGESESAVFGRGPTMRLDEDSPQYQAREAVCNMADSIQTGYEQAHGKPMARNVAMELARSAYRSGEGKPAPAAKPGIDWSKHQSARATGPVTGQQKLTPEQEAKERLRELNRKHGGYVTIPD